MKTLNEDLVTEEKSTILAHDGPGRAPQRAKGCLGRNLGHFGGPMAITSKKGQIARLHGSYLESDKFYVFMMFSRRGEKKIVAAALRRCQFYQGRDTICKKKVTERPPNDHSKPNFNS